MLLPRLNANCVKWANSVRIPDKKRKSTVQKVRPLSLMATQIVTRAQQASSAVIPQSLPSNALQESSHLATLMTTQVLLDVLNAQPAITAQISMRRLCSAQLALTQLLEPKLVHFVLKAMIAKKFQVLRHLPVPPDTTESTP